MTHKKTVLYSKKFYLQMLTTYSFVTQKNTNKNFKKVQILFVRQLHVWYFI